MIYTRNELICFSKTILINNELLYTPIDIWVCLANRLFFAFHSRITVLKYLVLVMLLCFWLNKKVTNKSKNISITVNNNNK